MIASRRVFGAQPAVLPVGRCACQPDGGGEAGAAGEDPPDRTLGARTCINYLCTGWYIYLPTYLPTYLGM